MKRIFLLYSITILVFYSGCKKESTATLDNQIKNAFFDSAVQFLKVTLSTDDYAKLDLTENNILRYRNRNIGIQIFEKQSSKDKFLILGINSGNYIGNWVDLSGLNPMQGKYQSGLIFLKALDGKSYAKLMVDSNEVIKIIRPNSDNSGIVTEDLTKRQFQSLGQPKLNSALRTESNIVALPEVVVYVHIFPDDTGDYTSLFWLFNSDYSYSDMYFYSGGGGGGGSTNGNQSNNVSIAPIIISPDAPIGDLKQEFKCFTNNNSSSYGIGVNVNEPFPNSRDVFNPSSPFTVGHTFLTLEQDNSDGTKIIRNVGFYPKSFVKPGAENAVSTFGDDSYTPFDVSLQFKVNGSDFNTVLNTLINQQAYHYDLDNFNCTTSPIDALSSINIHLPDTKSADILFTGNDPADLGEDIRYLNLDNFSAQNGNRLFTKNLSNSNNQTAPQRVGTCP